MNNRSDSSKARGRSAALEWIFGGIGLVLTLAMLGFIGRQAFVQGQERPPHIELRVERVTPAGSAYIAEIVASNRSTQTAKGVEIEGVLTPGDGDPETSSVSFDYVPGGSSVRGGLHFSSDPAAGELQLRALGHTRP